MAQCVAEGVCTSTTIFCCNADGNLQTIDDGTLVRNPDFNEPKCRCPFTDDDPTGTQGEESRGLRGGNFVIVWAIVIVVLFLCYHLSRCRNNGRRRYETNSSDENARIENEMKTKTEICKSSLVTPDSTPQDAQCCVCLSPLDDDDVVRPAACQHCYHRACLEEWIDQVKSKSVIERDRTTRTQLARRMLSCPICARPFVKDIVEEEDNDEEDAPGPSRELEQEMVALGTSSRPTQREDDDEYNTSRAANADRLPV